MLRSILAVIAGLVVAWITVSLFEFASMHTFPPPPGLDVRDPQQLAGLVSRMPVGALALVLAGWIVGALDGGVVAASIAKRRTPAIVVGGFVALGALLMVALVAHPLWMSLAGVLLPVPAAMFGAWLARGRRAAR